LKRLATVYSWSTGSGRSRGAAIDTLKGFLTCWFAGDIGKPAALLRRIQNPSNVSSNLIGHTI